MPHAPPPSEALLRRTLRRFALWHQEVGADARAALLGGLGEELLEPRAQLAKGAEGDAKDGTELVQPPLHRAR